MRKTGVAGLAALVATATLFFGAGFAFTQTGTPATSAPATSKTTSDQSHPATSSSDSSTTSDTTTGTTDQSKNAGTKDTDKKDDTIDESDLTSKVIAALKDKAKKAAQDAKDAAKKSADAKKALEAAQKALDDAKNDKDSAANTANKNILKDALDAYDKYLNGTNTAAQWKEVTDAVKKVADQLKDNADFDFSTATKITESLNKLQKRLADHEKTVKDLTASLEKAKKNAEDLATKADDEAKVATKALNTLNEAYDKWVNKEVSKYSDVRTTDCYAPAIAKVTDNGLMTGYKNGKFGSHDPTTREMAATILYRRAGSPKVDTETTSYPDDSKISPWARQAVVWAAQNHIMNGYGPEGSNAKFGPPDPLTREQAAKIIAIASKKYQKPSADSIRRVQNMRGAQGLQLAEYMTWAVNNKLINGWPDKRGLQPNGRINRAQMAQILANALDNNIL